MNLHISASKEELAVDFAEYLQDWLRDKNEVHIALSGGSTPKRLFEILSDTEQYKINWAGVHLYWGDERCVPPTDQESNFKMTNDALLSNINIPPKNIHRIYGENSPAKEAIRYAKELEASLPKVANIPVFDLVILGMGEDGHTASIFPHEIQLWEAKEFCAVATHPETGQKRITLTGDVINSAVEVAFLVAGSGKKDKVAEIIHKRGAYQNYPASLVAPHTGNLSWFLDKEAAAEI